MKPAKYGSCAIAYGLTLCLAVAQSPTLLTPGTSTESSVATSTGTSTTFTLTGNTIFNWDQLNLAQGSDLNFDFQSGNKVLNLLSGSGKHSIDGTVTSNGIVAFFAPNANFDIKGSINAKGVVLSTLSPDAVNQDRFLSGSEYSLSGEGGNLLSIFGNVTAEGGKVVLAGNVIEVDGGATIQASDSVLIGGGTDVSVSGESGAELNVSSDSGNVINFGTILAPNIRTSTGGSVSNGGTIDAGDGQIFIEVGEGMTITNESNGVILARSSSPDVDDLLAGVIIRPNEGDSAAGLSSGSLNLPMLKRPDGSVVSERQVVSTSVPVSASEDGGRDVTKANRSIVKDRSSNRSSRQLADSRGGAATGQGRASLMKRSSFFGVRGGQGKTTKR